MTRAQLGSTYLAARMRFPVIYVDGWPWLATVYINAMRRWP